MNKRNGSVHFFFLNFDKFQIFDIPLCSIGSCRLRKVQVGKVNVSSTLQRVFLCGKNGPGYIFFPKEKLHSRPIFSGKMLNQVFFQGKWIVWGWVYVVPNWCIHSSCLSVKLTTGYKTPLCHSAHLRNLVQFLAINEL